MMTAATDTNSRLSFNAGTATGKLTLDNVKISQLDYIEIPPEGSQGSTMLNTVRLERTGVENYAVFGMNGMFLGRVSADRVGLHVATKNLVKHPGVYLVKSRNGNVLRLKVR